ncbi:hypothetical protein [Paenibacillus tengchongensis]|uniref:hypothetical protein n=1 Tax=Paenibacillus tengchongensis TaxID=2608684 RepID=UPI00124F298B|nr:hypothetical protein [Paenibacillus tengchongensis]
MALIEISFHRQPRLDRHFVVTHVLEQIAVPADFFFGILPDVDMHANDGFLLVTPAQFEAFGFAAPEDSVKYFRAFSADAADRSIYFVHLPRTKQNLVIPRKALAKIAGISGNADVGITPPLSTAQLQEIGFFIPSAVKEAAAYEFVPAC